VLDAVRSKAGVGELVCAIGRAVGGNPEFERDAGFLAMKKNVGIALVGRGS
jgi:hypothetical protein